MERVELQIPEFESESATASDEPAMHVLDERGPTVERSPRP
jgi:hypothetical protein